MKILVYSTKEFERSAFKTTFGKMNLDKSMELTFTDVNLTVETAVLATGFSAVCLFVTDPANKECLKKLNELGVKVLLLRSAGFNHIDCQAARELGLVVLRVPKYSPEAIAEFTIGLYLCLNRKIHRAHDRVREGNFSIEGLMGHNVSGQTIGVIGTGNIGKCVSQIFRGFGAQVVAFDIFPDISWAKKYDVRYIDLQELLKTSDVITLHIPLTPKTQHILNKETISKIKSKAYLINTSRGGLIDTEALMNSLKEKRLAGAALDVYEEEENLFFKNLSEEIIKDDQFSILNSFPNVLVTSHQAFLTEEAVTQIAQITLENAKAWIEKKPLVNVVEVPIKNKENQSLEIQS
jgi:D-lactate dehydrogenase